MAVCEFGRGYGWPAAAPVGFPLGKIYAPSEEGCTVRTGTGERRKQNHEENEASWMDINTDTGKRRKQKYEENEASWMEYEYTSSVP